MGEWIMNKIIIASHGELALGMKNTVEFFGGSGVEYVEQTLTDTGFENRVIEILTKYKDDNCVVFTDLYGGSVNQCFFKNLNDFNFHLVTGMNLAVILECVLASVEIDEEFIRNAIEMSKSQFCYMNDLVNMASDDDDD